MMPSEEAIDNSTIELDNSQNGIAIEDALSILSARKPNQYPDCNSVGESAKFMGQKIDLFGAAPVGGNERDEEKIEQEQRRINREERYKKLQNELNGMSEKELVFSVLNVQEDRVKTYKEYETDLGVVLQTGNVTSYPDACLRATAAFSVLSETMMAIQSVLERRKQKELTELLKQLQGFEKEKLHLTAAHHLERIRKQNEAEQPNSDAGTLKLLEDGVALLQRKINTNVEDINETIDEIRLMTIDLDD